MTPKPGCFVSYPSSLRRALVKCGGLTLNATEFLARGYDAGTTIFPTLPTNDTIIGWARELLEMKKTARGRSEVKKRRGVIPT